jgi:hypothetical protein
MNSYARFFLYLGCAGGLLVGAGTAAPGWLARMGLDPGEICEAINSSWREQLRHEELVARGRPLHDSLEAKVVVTQDLRAGRVTLREAASRFQALNHACPEYDWERFRQAFPGQTDEERHCRQVLVAADNTLRGAPDCEDEVLTRLQAEFRDLFEAQRPPGAGQKNGPMP